VQPQVREGHNKSNALLHFFELFAIEMSVQKRYRLQQPRSINTHGFAIAAPLTPVYILQFRSLSRKAIFLVFRRPSPLEDSFIRSSSRLPFTCRLPQNACELFVDLSSLVMRATSFRRRPEIALQIRRSNVVSYYRV
jgi:hypothetical protein